MSILTGRNHGSIKDALMTSRFNTSWSTFVRRMKKTQELCVELCAVPGYVYIVWNSRLTMDKPTFDSQFIKY